MGMEDFDDIPPQPPDREVQLANGVGITVGALTFVYGVREIWAVDFVGISIAVGAGIAAWGATRAATALIDWLLDRLEQWHRATNTAVPPATAQQEPPAVAITTIEDAATIETNEPLTPWEEALEDKLMDSDRFLKLGDHQWAIPNTVNVNHLFQLAEARATGKLRFMVSANALDEEAGISRNGKSPNAQSLIDFFLNIGAVQNKGDRRPMPWTELGTQLFPDKFVTPPPAYANGQAAFATT